MINRCSLQPPSLKWVQPIHQWLQPTEVNTFKLPCYTFITAHSHCKSHVSAIYMYTYTPPDTTSSMWLYTGYSIGMCTVTASHRAPFTVYSLTFTSCVLHRCVLHFSGVSSRHLYLANNCLHRFAAHRWGCRSSYIHRRGVLSVCHWGWWCKLLIFANQLRSLGQSSHVPTKYVRIQYILCHLRRCVCVQYSDWPLLSNCLQVRV